MALASLLSQFGSLAWPVPDLPYQFLWMLVWAATLSLVGMGIRDVLGGEDDGAATEVEADDDFLDDELGEVAEDGPAGFDDGLDAPDEEDQSELEPRIDDLEAELADLSSSISTVRGEHEDMRESVEDIEDNVRQLLEVYEVVTQEANPFADGGPAVDAETSDTGLFEADADESEGDDPDTSTDDLFEDVEPAGDDESDGRTFDELSSGAESTTDEVAHGQDTDDGDGSLTAKDESQSASPPDAVTAPSKPYLADLPGGFGTEVVLMDWMDFLVSKSTVSDAIEAIRYYESVDWIGDEVASHLRTLLSGMGPTRKRGVADGGRSAALSVDHHTRSLEYISQLRSFDAESEARPGFVGAMRELDSGSDDHGVQR